MTSKRAKKQRNTRVARLILDGATDEQIMAEVRGVSIYDITGMRGFLRSARGRKWAVDKGFVEAPAEAVRVPLDPAYEPASVSRETPLLPTQPKTEVEKPSTPLSQAQKPMEKNVPENVPEPIPSPEAVIVKKPIQKGSQGVPAKIQGVEPSKDEAPLKATVSDEIVEVEMLGVPRKIKVSPETLLWYSWFIEGKLPIQKKPFEGDLGDFFDLMTRDFFHSRGCRFVVRTEEEVA